MTDQPAKSPPQTERPCFPVIWMGHRFLAFNSWVPAGTDIVAADEDNYDGVMFFYWDGKMWNVTLRHPANPRSHVDLSHLAKAYGGSGEKGRASFKTAQIPFPLFPIK